jgi:ketosteroid isomerase-like protein
MSRENVEVVEAANEVWNSGDMQALVELYHPDIFMRMAEGWPEPGPYVGRDAVIDQFRRMREGLEGDRVELLGDYLEIADHVVVRAAWRGTGRGPEMAMEATIVFTVRRGRISSVEFFWDHAETLEAVGLSE